MNTPQLIGATVFLVLAIYSTAISVLRIAGGLANGKTFNVTLEFFFMSLFWGGFFFLTH
jgi:hypothetical protein